jgi:hypothetical protein
MNIGTRLTPLKLLSMPLCGYPSSFVLLNEKRRSNGPMTLHVEKREPGSITAYSNGWLYASAA